MHAHTHHTSPAPRVDSCSHACARALAASRGGDGGAAVRPGGGVVVMVPLFRSSAREARAHLHLRVLREGPEGLKRAVGERLLEARAPRPRRERDERGRKGAPVERPRRPRRLRRRLDLRHHRHGGRAACARRIRGGDGVPLERARLAMKMFFQGGIQIGRRHLRGEAAPWSHRREARGRGRGGRAGQGAVDRTPERTARAAGGALHGTLYVRGAYTVIRSPLCPGARSR